MRKPVVTYEFYQDTNGAVFVHYLKVGKNWERSIPWNDFSSRKEQHKTLEIMYHKVYDCHPVIAERTMEKDKFTIQKMLKDLLRFIGYYMSEDDDSEYDFILYEDGTTEMNLENVICAINCPVLRDSMALMQTYQSSEHPHFTTLDESKKIIHERRNRAYVKKIQKQLDRQDKK